MMTLMVQGTTSDAGKTTVVAALCRWLTRQNVSVAPFKPQNMALNSAVTIDGGEIGRSTALQALACGLAPHSDMNPVLLKPQSDCGAQIIVRGHVYGNLNAVEYHDFKAEAMPTVLAAWRALSERHDIIIAEGAGSPAEINLRTNDIANMGFAEAADCPVLLVGDIDRGGVFAQLVGTLELLSESERRRIKGFVINRFRGDIALLQPGLDWLQARTGIPVVGVLPYLQGLVLDAEDSVGTAGTLDTEERPLKIIIPVLPRISNHNDFDPLRLHKGVDLQFIGPDQPVPAADVILLPGSKSTRQDLLWLKSQGWPAIIERHLRYGGKVFGICGGMQMLGHAVHDPLGIEGNPGSTAGLGLLDIETTLAADKTLRTVKGSMIAGGIQAALNAYEIHNGESSGNAFASPLMTLDGRTEGAISHDGQVMGTYLHGVFDKPAACHALLVLMGFEGTAAAIDYPARRENELNRLADMVSQHLERRWLDDMFGLTGQARTVP